jgi:hypothetical protein
METSTAQAAKLIIVAATGLSKDALHIYVGMSVFLFVAAIARRPISSWLPWAAVLMVALLGEVVDMRDDLLSLGRWRWSASLHDIINTLLWPTVLSALARTTEILATRRK